MLRKRKSEVETSPGKSLQEYLDFTASPTRDRANRTEDFKKLLQLPGLIDFGTNGKNTLIAQTEVVTIVDEETDLEHEIGSFLIYIIRERHGRMWTVDFRYENTTQVVDGCMHPHILVSEYVSIPRPTGWLCIKQGQHGVYQAIREARIPDALEQLIDILYIYQCSGQNRPFRKIANWPVVGDET